MNNILHYVTLLLFYKAGFEGERRKAQSERGTRDTRDGERRRKGKMEWNKQWRVDRRHFFRAFPHRACLALYASFVLRSPEKRQQIAPALKAKRAK